MVETGCIFKEVMLDMLALSVHGEVNFDEVEH